VIAEDLRPLAFPVADLELLPGNPRRGDVDAVGRSLEEFGQRKPIVVRRSDRVVVAGNHTLQAAQRLGWESVAVVWVDDDDTRAKAFALADNRTAELGGYDDEALAEMIAGVRGADPELLAATGWSEADVLAVLATTEGVADPLAEWTAMPEYESENHASVFSTVVHFARAEDADNFFKTIDRPKRKSMWWPAEDGFVGSSVNYAYVAED
jgi:hypothetical protein